MKRHFGTATVLGLLIAGLGVVSPILWDNYKTKAGLELRHIATITLAEKTDGLDKLQISYDSQSIRSVTKLAYVLFNFGRRPILESELVVPPHLTFQPPNILLDAQIDSTSPDNLRATSIIDRSNGVVSVTFPLMNPGDTVRFSVLVASTAPEFHPAARIVGVSDLTFVSLRTVQAFQERRIPWTVYPVGFFSVFVWLFVLAGAIPDLFREARVRRRLKEGRLAVPSRIDPSFYPSFVLTTFSYKTSDERKTLLAKATDLSKQKVLTEKQHDDFMKDVEGLCNERSATVPALWFFGILGIIGVGYILVKVLQ
jgi:hypothetical protein